MQSQVGGRRVRERSEDATLFTLKEEEAAISQGIQVAFRTWKRQGKSFLKMTPERITALLIFNFSPLRPTSDF